MPALPEVMGPMEKSAEACLPVSVSPRVWKCPVLFSWCRINLSNNSCDLQRRVTFLPSRTTGPVWAEMAGFVNTPRSKEVVRFSGHPNSVLLLTSEVVRNIPVNQQSQLHFLSVLLHSL